jgi:hypothetical protein
VNGPAHVRFSPAVAVPVAAAAHLPLPQAALVVAVAGATAGGWLSPDADQGWMAWAPGGHRGLTHWPGIPAAVLALGLGAPWPLVQALLLGVAAGWGSHDLADFAFGRPAPRQGREAGIPWLLWWGHAGLLGRRHGLRSDGTPSRVFSAVVVPALIAWEAASWWHGALLLPAGAG